MKRNWGGIIGLFFGGLGLIIGIYASINPQGVMSFMETSHADTWLPIGIPIFVVVIMLASFGPVAMSAIKNSQKKKHLLQVGQKTTGTILDVRDTGVTVNMNPYVKITVQTKNGVKAEFQMLISRVQIPRVGDEIELLYDPSDPTSVMPAP